MSAVEKKQNPPDTWRRPRGNGATLDEPTHTGVRTSSRKIADEEGKSPVRPGEVIAAKYRVERIIGSGDMGVVVAARHVQLGFLVAIKFMHPEAVNSPHAAKRFFREARAVARLRGEYATRVRDFGTLASGPPYIVMDLLEGSDLESLLQKRGALPVSEAVAYVLDACAAMDEAHQAGIVHRDLKPKNLFLTRRPDGTPLVKVLDFGISKLAATEEDRAGSPTRTGSILGSPGFMSPEQIRDSKRVDARADIYGLGAVLYYLLANDYPFAAVGVSELFGKILYDPPRSLRDRRPDVPVALEAVVGRCLQKKATDRYSNVKELMAALREAMDRSSDSLEQTVVDAPFVRAYVAPGAATVAIQPRLHARARLGALVIAGAITSVLLGALLARCVEPSIQPSPPTPHHTTTR
ncbi:serine/threonine protein kinase [Pendulispora brunnea]|uniref:Serine/threonine protein kinase n=1 Tax=Pendulispora brunnea TaxID=2905690 RepID=A0ABZ2K261_9BACT